MLYKTKRIASLFLAVMLISALMVPAMANTTGTTPVTLDSAAAIFNVTVPTALPVNINNQGVVTTSNDVKIINNSWGAIKVVNLAVEAQNGWSTANFFNALDSSHYDAATKTMVTTTGSMAKEKVGTKKIALAINDCITLGANSIQFTASKFARMDGVGGNNTAAIQYNAIIPAQDTALTNANLVNVIFTVGWDTVA